MNLCDIPAAYHIKDTSNEMRLEYGVDCRLKYCCTCLAQHNLYRTCPQCGIRIPGEGFRRMHCECGAIILICSTGTGAGGFVTEFTIDSPVANLTKIEEDII